MSINPLRWRTRTLISTIITIIIFYFIFIHKKSDRIQSVGIIKDVHPAKVWEFVADFSNMKLLNSLIVNFNIIAESGNYDHWQYSVEYTEYLRYFPLIKNVGVGHFSIRNENGIYLISSNHNTCFFWFLCVKSTSEFKFEKDEEKNTRCTENVEYHCPITFKFLCDKEVTEQRKEIMNRLKVAFSK
ncbi:PREDICTED: uncharacterized protein LOC107063922 [Polistes dominula]|uniref:Uncharacterized protein LOC107063922 n=1 Tax=Polistes dominula TaxID=743375 RepID=A0ABM1HUD6_POLDO|nr:PREDICTED: uncharacterized protein LOC107063922 [Polistes dominula]XP_015171573.1 PREDICTED: uncharacterized protein LOC107063922 [Polistes dominula]XP_015171574.1 PREDICTED: uncharacterized protein LOC107063922 [Polistes dominula]